MKVTKLSIIVPALNEIATIEYVYQKLSNLRLGIPYELIFIDDGSTDGTTTFLKSLKKANHKNVKVLFHKERMGKGAALRTGLAEATGSHVAIQDADNEYDPRELKKLVVEANKRGYCVVYGSRNKDIANLYLYPLFYWGSKSLSFMINTLFHQKLTDPVTCFKLIPSELLRFIDLTEKGFGVEIEITSKIAGLKIPIYEVSITYNPRTFAEGKKIRSKDGIRSIYLIFNYWIKDLHYGTFDRILRKIREHAVLSRIRLNKSMALADIGCGRQAHLGWSLRHKIKTYTGVDLEVPNMRLENIRLIQEDVDHLSAGQLGRKIDVIVSCAVIEHLKNPKRFVKLSRDMLKKGGLLCITTPHPKTHDFLHLIGRLHIIDHSEIHDHKYYFDVNDLRKLLMANGFEVLTTKRFLFGLNGLAIAKKV